MKFTWDSWNFDGHGDAYVIAKKECSEKENVPDFICENDDIPDSKKQYMNVQEGCCKYQIRCDWEGHEGERLGGYYAKLGERTSAKINGWFPVWIVRKEEWY